jgi:hypothetical protein
LNVRYWGKADITILDFIAIWKHERLAEQSPQALGTVCETGVGAPFIRLRTK